MLVKLTWASASHGNWIECGCWLQVEMIRSCPLAPVNVRFPPIADLNDVRLRRISVMSAMGRQANGRTRPEAEIAANRMVLHV